MDITRKATSQEELKRFLVVAKQLQETGQQALMPACPVDQAWHDLLESPDEYKHFCHQVVGGDVLHEPCKGEGELGWTKVYEDLYGHLPEVWFQDSNGVLNERCRQEYLETGVFRASWDCTPYILAA